jgi:hypothetical protein
MPSTILLEMKADIDGKTYGKAAIVDPSNPEAAAAVFRRMLRGIEIKANELDREKKKPA